MRLIAVTVLAFILGVSALEEEFAKKQRDALITARIIPDGKRIMRGRCTSNSFKCWTILCHLHS